jgi:hypothetical protein
MPAIEVPGIAIANVWAGLSLDIGDTAKPADAKQAELVSPLVQIDGPVAAFLDRLPFFLVKAIRWDQIWRYRRAFKCAG